MNITPKIFFDALHGESDELKVKSVAILTAENPCAEETSETDNIKRNHELEVDINKDKYTYKQIWGKYGDNPENPYVIFDISYDEAERMAEKYDQKSFIWVEVNNGYPDGAIYFTGACGGTSGEVEMEINDVEFGEDIDKSFGFSAIDGVKFNFLEVKEEMASESLFYSKIHDIEMMLEGGKCTKVTKKASSTAKGKKWMKCVKDGDGYKRIHWGQKGVRVTGKSGNTKRKKSFRARHNCSSAKKGTPRYQACKDW